MTKTAEMMPRYGYLLRFHYLDSGETEEYAYHELEDASHHMEQFDDSDGDLYSSIELLEYDYLEQTSRLLAITFFVDEDDEADNSADDTLFKGAYQECSGPEDDCDGDCAKCETGCDPEDPLPDEDCRGCTYVQFWLDHHRD